MARSNRETLLACMIEDIEAVERIDEIAAVSPWGPMSAVALPTRKSSG